ncbi:MAG: histidine kinase [Frankiales bacterium]|nr:histidine kinase [Frankiales bacterium]
MADVGKRVIPGLELVIRVPLRQDARAPAQARAAIRETLTRWRLLPGVIDAVVLAASELVTNAIRHGAPPVQMTLRRRGCEVRVDVQDDSVIQPDMHPPRHAGQLTESGRGIQIVKALADRVGCERVDRDRKVVFASFDVEYEASKG